MRLIRIPNIAHQPLTKDLLKDIENNNQSDIDWINRSWNTILSEDFIRKYQDKLNWSNISTRQTLSESFIREFQYKVNWYGISLYQNLSIDFIIEFKDYMIFELLMKNKKTQPEIKELCKIFI